MKKIIIFSCLFCCLLVTAQNLQTYNYNNKSLAFVLKDIQEKNDIEFSYESQLIKKKIVELISGEYLLQNLISEIAKQTQLKFKKISDSQYIILSSTKSNKYCGYIIDKESTFPISNTVIKLSNGKEIQTDKDGFFEFDSPEINAVTIEVLGYQKQLIERNTNCPKIVLSPKGQQLSEVIISSYITSGIDRNTDGSIDVNTNKLGVLPGLVSPDIAQSIQLIPGITSIDESATGIQIRGGSPDQNLVLYDNIKLYNTGYFYGMFSLFNPFAVKNAHIFRSGTSVIYGDRISGIIDVSSGNDIPTRTEGGFEIDGLSVNGYAKTALSPKLGVYIFARKSYTEALETPTFDSYAKKIFSNAGTVRDINGTILDLETDDDITVDNSNNKLSFADINAKIIFKPNPNNHITISGLYTNNSLDFDFDAGEEKSVDDLNTENKGFSVKWSHTTNSKQQEELSAYYSEYDSFYQNEELEDETGDDNLDVTEINIRENIIIDTGVSLTSTTQVTSKQQLKLGYQLSNANLTVGVRKIKPFETEENESDPQDKRNLKNALFGEYTFNLKNKGLINTGLRLVHYGSLNELKLEPRINFEYPIANHFRIKSAIEIRNQPISQLVEFGNTELRLENNLWRLSDNENFPLLSSNQISGGVLYSYKNLNIDIDSYYKELDGLTTFTSGFSNPLENLETGESTIKGVDFLLKYKLKNFRVWAGYTYNDITFKFPNLENTTTSFPGNNDIKHQFRLSNTLTVKNWQFSLGWHIRSGKPITPVNSYTIKLDADNEKAGVVEFGAINSDRLPSFHRLDASILYDFYIGTKEKKKQKAQIGISALNIYNRIQPLDLIYKAEIKPLDDGGIAKPGTTGATQAERELILEQVIQRFSLGFTPNIAFRIFF